MHEINCFLWYLELQAFTLRLLTVILLYCTNLMKVKLMATLALTMLDRYLEHPNIERKMELDVLKG